jgi:hypothetical protein
VLEKDHEARENEAPVEIKMRLTLLFLVGAFGASCTLVPPVSSSAIPPGRPALVVSIDEPSFDRAQAVIGNPEVMWGHYPVDARRAAVRTVAAALGGGGAKDQFPSVAVRLEDFAVTGTMTPEPFNSFRHDVETFVAVRADFVREEGSAQESVTILARGRGSLAGDADALDRLVPKAIQQSVNAALNEIATRLRTEVDTRFVETP